MIAELPLPRFSDVANVEDLQANAEWSAYRNCVSSSGCVQQLWPALRLKATCGLSGGNGREVTSGSCESKAGFFQHANSIWCQQFFKRPLYFSQGYDCKQSKGDDTPLYVSAMLAGVNWYDNEC